MLISCACYVITWEIIYFTLLPDFGEKYAALRLEHCALPESRRSRLKQEIENMKDDATLQEQHPFQYRIYFP
jgi:hypothetical protein